MQKELDTLECKMINDASAFIKAQADRHGRNAEWGIKAVREAVSLSAGEALAIGVIDIIGKDIPDLLPLSSQKNHRLCNFFIFRRLTILRPSKTAIPLSFHFLWS